MTQPIRKLTLSGTPYEIGFAHGVAYRDLIRAYAAERLHLVCDGSWTARPTTPAHVLQIAEACLPAHAAYAPDLYEEWQGMAAATDLSLAELLIVGGFTDFVDTVYNLLGRQSAPADNCTAFLVPDSTADGAGFFGQTWDMHASAAPYVILLDVRPDTGAKSLIFTTTGCVGQIGMNEHGVAIGINNLLGADGQIGVTWNFVVRKALQQTNAADALACVLDAKLAGAHNYLIMDKTGAGYNVEAMSTVQAVTPLAAEPIVHTNHCLVPRTLAAAQPRPADLQLSSRNRLADANGRLTKRPITIGQLKALTRDENSICHYADPVRHTLTCGAVIMRPRTQELWAVAGLPSENEYAHFVVSSNTY